MSTPIQLFENFIVNNASRPDIYYYDCRKFIEPNDNFIISRNNNGEILSVYNDNLWDLTPYAPGLNQSYKFHFYKNLKDKKNISEFKKLFFLMMVIGSPFRNEIYSVTTLSQSYKILSSIAEFAESINKRLYQVLEDTNQLTKFISKYKDRSKYLCRLTSILLFLEKADNNLTGISFKKDEELLRYLRKIAYNESLNNNQTALIPSRIFIESIKERWIQINELEKDIHNLTSFMLKIINCKYFAASKKFKTIEYKNNENFIEWDNAIKKYQLSKLFKKYKVNNKFKLRKFVRQIQGTCNHLIHAYTGMRRTEVLSLKVNCLRKIDDNKYARIIGTTTKFDMAKKTTEWVTTYEIEKVLNILNKLSKVLSTKIFFKKEEDRFLFISTTNLSSRIPKTQKIVSTGFLTEECLPLSKKSTIIDEEAIKELENIDYNRNWRNEEEFNIGNTWKFKTHQYRRSLAVYSIQSGIVSLGSLKNQFKHLFREMSYYYQNNCINAKNLLELNKNHIGNEINVLTPIIHATEFIKNIVYSEEKKFNIHGEIINPIYNKNISVKDKNKIVESFKNGEIWWKENSLGGCTEIKPCDSKLTKSLIECLGCNMAIHKISKIERTIFHMERFIDSLESDSIEYRTETYDLNILKSYLNKINKKV
ncbi:hypothetical protein [Aliarcobacter cryaerophilus]|uniref:hypothetical protein n=1 Tax=Aliarcobacter cryaerophilus TaxID=28198 RepID=UPI003DA21848